MLANSCSCAAVNSFPLFFKALFVLRDISKIININDLSSLLVELVKTYSHTIANAAILLATLLAIYSSIDVE